jgi:hypothetical protein
MTEKHRVSEWEEKLSREKVCNANMFIISELIANFVKHVKMFYCV